MHRSSKLPGLALTLSSILLPLALLLQAEALPAQTPASTAAGTPHPPAATQLPLNVDRDPVRSPDAEVSPATAGTSAAQPSQPTATTPTQSPAGAGDTLSRGEHGGYTLRREVEEVILNATVLDEHDRLVNDLKKPDFKVQEDGVVQTITSFQHQDVPVSMGLIVDNSGSMYKKRPAVNNAAIDLVKASNPDDEAFVVNFADEAYIDQEFTADTNKLHDGLSHLESKGGTALYDAVVASADEMSKHAHRAKQVLIVVTDGEDNASSLNLEQAIRRVQQLEGPQVYCIGLLFGDEMTGRERSRASRAMNLLSDETGGVAFFPKSIDEVDGIANTVAQMIRNQYTIGYRSTKPSSMGGYRRVQVEAKSAGHGKLNVRTRAGYFPTGSTSTNQPQVQKPAP